MFFIAFKFLKFLEKMDKLGDYVISDEEEPRPKSRKTGKIPQKPIQKKIIRKSNFSQVRMNKISEKQYQKWIKKHNSKISDHFKKVLSY